MIHTFGSVGPATQRALDKLDEACQKCVALDVSELNSAVKKIEDKHFFCPADDVRRFQQDVMKLVHRLRVALLEVHHRYKEDFAVHLEKPRQLQEAGDAWRLWDNQIDPIHRIVENKQRQTFWKGKGADGYMKQLPIQAAAIQELRDFGATQCDATIRSAMVLQAVLIGVRSAIQDAQWTVESYARAPQDGSNSYMVRTAKALNKVSALANWLDAVRSGETWSEPTGELTRQLQLAGGQVKMMLKDVWPSATNPGAPVPPQQPGYGYGPGGGPAAQSRLATTDVDEGNMTYDPRGMPEDASGQLNTDNY